MRKRYLSVAAAILALGAGNLGAAVVSQTVNFGTGGTGNFNLTGNSAGTSLSDSFTSNIVTVSLTVSVDFSAAETDCPGTDANCRITGSVDGFGVDSIGFFDTTELQETEQLRLTFDRSVQLTRIILSRVDGDDGSNITRISPSVVDVLNADPLGGLPLTGDTLVSEVYNSGLQNLANWTGTVFNFLPNTGGGILAPNDFYLSSITFAFEDTPEPATYAMFAGGLLALLAARRFRARRSN